MPPRRELVLLGGGGHAKVVADVARGCGFTIKGVLTPDGEVPSAGFLRLGSDDWIDSHAPASDVAFHIAFGPRHGTDLRQRIYESLTARGLSFPTIVASSATVSPSARIGPGTILLEGVTLNADSRIGRNCIVNTRAIVEHDVHVGDHVHIAPGAILCGAAQVGSRAFIGAGAIVLPGVVIAEGATVGAGSVVTRSIEAPETVCWGNPARLMK